jgi:hypothetical protein
MLTLALILSVAGTSYCIWAEAQALPRKPTTPPTQVTPVQVSIDMEDDPTDDDADPPTVVQTRP